MQHWLWKHEEFMLALFSIPSLTVHLAFWSMTEQWLGIFRELSTWTMGFLLPRTIARTTPNFLGHYLDRLPLPQHYSADQHRLTSVSALNTPCEIILSFVPLILTLARLSSTISNSVPSLFTPFHIIYRCAEQLSFTWDSWPCRSRAVLSSSVSAKKFQQVNFLRAFWESQHCYKQFCHNNFIRLYLLIPTAEF